jgi:hypothetical protein
LTKASLGKSAGLIDVRKGRGLGGVVGLLAPGVGLVEAEAGGAVGADAAGDVSPDEPQPANARHTSAPVNTLVTRTLDGHAVATDISASHPMLARTRTRTTEAYVHRGAVVGPFD